MSNAQRRKTVTAAVTAGMAALIAASIAAGAPAWTIVVLIVLALPVTVLGALVWTRHA